MINIKELLPGRNVEAHREPRLEVHCLRYHDEEKQQILVTRERGGARFIGDR